MSKSPCFHCVCCDSPMEPKKKRPLTTATGDMKSVYSDAIPDFPYDEWEDLCNTCIRTIRDVNADLSSLHGNKEKGLYHFNPPVRIENQQDNMEEECAETRLDIPSRYVSYVYNGVLDD